MKQVKTIFIVDDDPMQSSMLKDYLSKYSTFAIHEFNSHVANDPRTEQVILSIRDGISLIRKV